MQNLKRTIAISLSSIVLAFSGCKTYEVKNHLTGHRIESVNQRQSPYILNEIVLPDVVQGKEISRRLYVQKGPAQEEAIDILLYPGEQTTRWINRSSEKVRFETQRAYIPKIAKNTNGQRAVSVSLLEKAVMEEPSIEGVSHDVLKTNQNNARYDLKSLDIKMPNGKTRSFYAVIVPKSEQLADNSKLNFYMIPVQNTEIGISPTGEMTLKSEEIYRPQLFKEDKTSIKKKDVISAAKTEYEEAKTSSFTPVLPIKNK